MYDTCAPLMQHIRSHAGQERGTQKRRGVWIIIRSQILHRKPRQRGCKQQQNQQQNLWQSLLLENLESNSDGVDVSVKHAQH